MYKEKSISNRKYFKYYIVLFIFIIYACYTSPMSIKNEIKGGVIGINIEKSYSTPGLDGKIVRNQINTSDLSEINKILDIMDNYRYCKNIKLSDGVGGYYKPVTAFWINLSYKTDTGEVLAYSQYINSDGQMSAGDWGKKGFPCDIGRFGNAGTKEYFKQLNKIYDEKSVNPKWSTVRRINVLK